MVLRVDVVDAALEGVYGESRPSRIVALTPQGRQLDQALVEELAQERELALLSSRFEGFDERIVTHLCTDAVSIGPYVLSGGELPAMVLLDAIARRLPGALAEGSGEHESFSAELDGGSSTRTTRGRPSTEGWDVPDVLLSGDHGAHRALAPRAESRAEPLVSGLGGSRRPGPTSRSCPRPAPLPEADGDHAQARAGRRPPQRSRSRARSTRPTSRRHLPPLLPARTGTPGTRSTG